MIDFITQWNWLIVLIAGFLCGSYVASARIRHVVNTIGIFILKHTDSYYKPDVIIRDKVREKVVEKPIFVNNEFPNRKTGVHLTQEEWDRMMANNPNIKVGEKP